MSTPPVRAINACSWPSAHFASVVRMLVLAGQRYGRHGAVLSQVRRFLGSAECRGKGKLELASELALRGRSLAHTQRSARPQTNLVTISVSKSYWLLSVVM
jgi:hypothetical protein